MKIEITYNRRMGSALVNNGGIFVEIVMDERQAEALARIVGADYEAKD